MLNIAGKEPHQNCSKLVQGNERDESDVKTDSSVKCFSLYLASLNTEMSVLKKKSLSVI